MPGESSSSHQPPATPVLQKEVTFDYTFPFSAPQPNPWAAFQTANIPLKRSPEILQLTSKAHCNSNRSAEIHSLGQSREIIIQMKHLGKVATGLCLRGHLYTRDSPISTPEPCALHGEDVLSPGSWVSDLEHPDCTHLSCSFSVSPFLFGESLRFSLCVSVSSYLSLSVSLCLSISLSLTHQNKQFLHLHTSFTFHSHFLQEKGRQLKIQETNRTGHFCIHHYPPRGEDDKGRQSPSDISPAKLRDYLLPLAPSGS